MRPHQILAINRGEHQKVLSVKVDIPQSLRYELHRFTRRVYLNDGLESVQREQFFEKAFEEAYTKKCRQHEKRWCDNFTKHNLLTIT